MLGCQSNTQNSMNSIPKEMPISEAETLHLTKMSLDWLLGKNSAELNADSLPQKAIVKTKAEYKALGDELPVVIRFSTNRIACIYSVSQETFTKGANKITGSVVGIHIDTGNVKDTYMVQALLKTHRIDFQASRKGNALILDRVIGYWQVD